MRDRVGGFARFRNLLLLLLLLLGKVGFGFAADGEAEVVGRDLKGREDEASVSMRGDATR